MRAGLQCAPVRLAVSPRYGAAISMAFESARNTSCATDSPFAPSSAMSKQNDRRRMSNECAVDLAVTREASTTDDLPAERGSGCGRGLAQVLGRTNEAPVAELHAVVDGTSVAKQRR